jgi:hypothetical protein
VCDVLESVSSPQAQGDIDLVERCAQCLARPQRVERRKLLDDRFEAVRVDTGAVGDE